MPSLLDQPQRLLILPSWWYWRRVDGLPAATAIALAVGLLSGFIAGSAIGWAPLAAVASPLLAVVFIGLVEQRIRVALRSRRRRRDQ